MHWTNNVKFYISKMKGADYYRVGYSSDLHNHYMRFKERFSTIEQILILLTLKGYEIDKKVNVKEYPNLIDLEEIYLLRKI